MANQGAMNQGRNFKNGKQQIIQKGFKSGREGFRGILGSNTFMDDVIQQDNANTQANRQSFNDNLAQYGAKYQSLKEETNSYIDNSRLVQDVDKNYNVFINQSGGAADIKESNQQGCVTRDSISNLRLASGFAAAYPQNFTNYSDANNACKVWAADSGKTVYAVTKDLTGKYQCYTGLELASNIKPNLKTATAYTVLAGDATAVQGGLFSNGQIGVWRGGGVGDQDAANSQWNINNMKKPSLLKKYNSTDYSNGPQGLAQAVRDNWWGTPGRGGWGNNEFPNDRDAWWISNEDHDYMGTMGYFYYIYNSPTARRIGIYTVVDDSCVIKVNGETISGGSWLNATLKAGKNVFEYKLVNTGGPGVFVFYAYELGSNNVLFRSGPDWGYTMNPVSDYNLVMNVVIDQANPRGLKTVNPAPTGYENCDPFIGGGIQKASVSASFGRNCSNVTNQPLMVRYVRVIPRTTGDNWLQISQIVVNAYVNSVLTNVAGRGTTTATDSWQSIHDRANDSATRLAKDIPIDGTFNARSYPNIYHAAYDNPNVFWQLDLGRDYPVTEIVYYNRADCCQHRANDAKIQLTANDGTAYQPIILSGGLKQNFNISARGITVAYPLNLGGYQYTKAEATDICVKRGERLCTRAELNKSDFCSCGWTSDSSTRGYPMANGDPTPQGWCGGHNGGQVWRDCGGGLGSTFCCK
jgi:hypothetical protein